jgi:hypothetical protein
MNWPLFWQLLTTAGVGFIGAWLAHIFATARDRRNKRREQQIDFLIQAYRRLEFVSNRPSSPVEMQQVESAMADIQLFGSTEQIRLVHSFIHEFAEKRTASLDNLLEILRNNLRAELELEKAPVTLVYLRWSASNVVAGGDSAVKP